MTHNVLKIGEVIEVRGQKVRALVYQDKNTSTLNYNGDVIKNISVGSFVKIRKNFLDIIGRVEGEFVNDKKNTNNFSEKNEYINRVIEISIVGKLDERGMFVRGLTELPLISNYVYILKDYEAQKIFSFAKESEPVISIGDINAYNQYKLKLGVQALFGSHIGVFGNTGSGKSNTLAKLYTELFELYKKFYGFNNNSRFVLIDFNGEYSHAIANNKCVLELSTKKAKDRYYLHEKDIEDLEFWSIILEATEKTQQPFLKRALNQYRFLIKDSERINDEIQKKIIELLDGLFNFGFKYNSVKRYYEELIKVGYDNIDSEIDALFNNISFNASTGSWYYLSGGITHYRNTEEDFKLIPMYSELISKLEDQPSKATDLSGVDYWLVFEFAMKYQYVYDVQRGYVNEEHIAPIIRRLDTRIADLKKVFLLGGEVEQKCNFNIISLLDVNIYMRKIVPMLICKREYDNHKYRYARKRDKVLHIIIDEAHNILSKQSDRESSTWKDYRLEIFEEIIKEGRKFGVFLTIASQRPSDISETIISQLHNYFLHRLVNNEDIKAIGRLVSFLDNASYEMIPILQQGACVVTGTACNFPVIVQVDLLEEMMRPRSNTIDLDAVWKNTN